MMFLVTGGANSGKSAYAEQLCMGLGGRRVYLAAMRPSGREGRERVSKHRSLRAGKGFETIECYESFPAAVDDPRVKGAAVLLECLGNVVANELFSGPFEPAGAVERIECAVTALAERASDVVIVANEVGADGFAYPAETREYQRVLGELSSKLAQRCDRVVECVAGVPIVLKEEGGHDVPA